MENIIEALGGIAEALVKAGAIDLLGMICAISLGVSVIQSAKVFEDPVRNNFVFWNGGALLAGGVVTLLIRLYRFTFPRPKQGSAD